MTGPAGSVHVVTGHRLFGIRWYRSAVRFPSGGVLGSTGGEIKKSAYFAAIAANRTDMSGCS
jgi:hypothetical protein